VGNWFGKLQKIGKALMLPVAVLPAAALLLRFGAPDVLDIPFVMKAGGAIFDNLALLFAMGIAIGLSHDNGGASGLSGAIGYLVLTNGVKTINPDLNMSVLGGILSGLVAGYLYNKFYNIKLPDFLGFFAGRRFVPIVTAATAIVMAGIFGVIWAPIQGVIHSIGEWIIGAGAFGLFIFGFFNRLLIPFGLHHILNSFIWFVFGNYTDATGKVVTGDLNRFFAGDPSAGGFMAGFYLIFMFALPGAALAIYTCAKPENRKKIGGMLLSVAFTAFLTGITEPLEFMFMFLAPMLYFLHAIMTGLALALVSSMGILHGFGFSAGLIDYLLNWGLATKPAMIIPLGLGFAALYYVVFVWAIKQFNIPTPGRFEDEAENTKLDTVDISSFSLTLMEKLGGPQNLEAVDSCITRLRLTVKNADLINENEIKALGAAGVIKSGKSVQIIVGTKAEMIADEMKKLQVGGKGRIQNDIDNTSAPNF
jgi:PTS system N-acetylglucosamine-specific IIC component